MSYRNDLLTDFVKNVVNTEAFSEVKSFFDSGAFNESDGKMNADNWVEAQRNLKLIEPDVLSKSCDTALLSLCDRVMKDDLDGKALQGTVLSKASDMKLTPINWLWKGWLACGKFHLLAGQAGTGKTTIALSMAATITKGGKWVDGSQSSCGSVLMWSGEDDPQDSLLPRLIASGADLEKVFFINGYETATGRRSFSPSSDMFDLMQKAEKIKDLKLIIVDPIVSAITGDSHKNAEVRRNLQPLIDLGQSLGVGILGITHFSKGGRGNDPTDRVTGSLAFAALARVVMCTAKPIEQDAARRLVRTKSNIGGDGGGFEYDLDRKEVEQGIEGQYVEWGIAIEGTARDLINDIEDDDEERTQTQGAEEWLIEVLSEGSVPAKDVKKLAPKMGFSIRTVERAAQKSSMIEPKKEGFGRDAITHWKLISSSYSPSKPHTRHDRDVASMEKCGEYDGDIVI